MEKLTKEELKSPDQFIKTAKTITHYIEEHTKLIFTIVGVLVAIGIGYSAYDIYRSSRDTKANEALFQARLKARDYVTSAQKAIEAQAAAKKKDEKGKKADTPAVPDATPSFSAEIVSNFEQVTKAHAGTVAAVQAALDASDYLSEYGKHEEAQKVLEPAASSAKGLFEGFYRFQLARVLEAQGKCEPAIQEWERVVQNAKLTQWHADALVKAGACYVSLKQNDKARASFEKVTKDHANSAAAQNAKKYLRLLDTAG